MKYKTIIETDDFEDFEFFEDGNGKYLHGIDSGAVNNEWIALYFTECEQEPCENAVSRQAVLNTLDKMDSVLDEDRTLETYKELLVACYNDLPSVTPIHKDRTDLKHPLLAEYKVESEEK